MVLLINLNAGLWTHTSSKFNDRKVTVGVRGSFDFEHLLVRTFGYTAYLHNGGLPFERHHYEYVTVGYEPFASFWGRATGGNYTNQQLVICDADLRQVVLIFNSFMSPTIVSMISN